MNPADRDSRMASNILNWDFCADIPAQEPNDVNIWCVHLEMEHTHYAHMLSKDETARADRFKFEYLKKHYIAGRGALRILLGKYLDTDPSKLTFLYGDKGKPFLADTQSAPLHFNISHSGKIALIAVTRISEIGVDVEHTTRKIKDMDDIAKRFFSESETSQLMTFSGNSRIESFYRCWTQKEAFIKTTGDGLSKPLDSFSVNMAPEQPAGIIHINGEPHEHENWTIIRLNPCKDYIGAAAIKAKDVNVRCFSFPHI